MLTTQGPAVFLSHSPTCSIQAGKGDKGIAPRPAAEAVENQDRVGWELLGTGGAGTESSRRSQQ